LDAALVSVTEVLFNDQYDVLDGIAVASRGEVRSVLLAHRQPLEQIREIFCDTASLTSFNLLRVLLAERGLRPELKPLPDYEQCARLDAVLLIGDPAIRFLLSRPDHHILDLGADWRARTGLPFVYAVWALRRSSENAQLRQILRASRDYGLANLDSVIREATDFDLEFRQNYLGRCVHYRLGSEEKKGLAKFAELLQSQGPGPVYEPRFVE
jgi:chorismate dehydratase